MPPIDKDAKIPCPTPQHLHAELENLTPILELPEKEETWEKHEAALIRLAGLTRGGAYKHVGPFVEGIGRQGLGLRIAACMMSDRGKLSATAIDFVQTIAPRLGGSFAPLVTVYLDPLIRLLGRPNKVVQKRVDKCLSTIISHCHLASVVLELKKGLTDDAVTCRRGCASVIQTALEVWDTGVWGEKGILALEEVIRKTAGDKDASVRQIGKALWALFSEYWPERVEEFAAPLTPTTRRRLDIAAPAAGTAKGKTVARSMGPPAMVSRPAQPSHNTASSSTAHPPKTAHSRGASASSHSSHLEKHGESSKRIPTVSAPTSPSKEKHDLPTLSRSISTAFRTEGLGMPSRPVQPSHNTSTHRLGSPERPDTWSKPSRPPIPTSYSAVSLSSEVSDNTAPRRFPPPSRALRPTPPSSSGSDDHVFTAPSSSSTAYPSVLRGPVRIPQQPPVSRLGPAVRPIQRRVVTAPTPQPDKAPIPATPSQTEIATILKDRKMVKKRVSELEEEIRTIPLPASPVPVLTKSPHGSYFAHISPSVLKQKMEAVDSPMMPVLLGSTSSKQVEENEDLRTVPRVEANGGEVLVGDETEERVSAGQLPTAEGPTPDDEARLDHEEEQFVSVNESMSDERALGDPHVGSTNTKIEELASALATVEISALSAAEDVPGLSEPLLDSSNDLQEKRDDRTVEEVESVSPVEEDIGNDESTQVHTESQTERRDSALHIPLPPSPAMAAVSLPDSTEAETVTEATVVAPPAVYPKEPPRRHRLLAQSTGSKAKTVDAKPVQTKKAAVPRKPAVPPPPAKARAPAAIERKTFKPSTTAARAAAKPIVAKAALPVKAAPPPSDGEQAFEQVAAGSRVDGQVQPGAPVAGRPSDKAPIPPRVGLGKGSTAPAIVARSVSAASSSTQSSKTASTIPVKPPVPKAPVPRTVKSSNPPPATASTTGATIGATTSRTVKPHASVTIPPVRADKIRRKAPLPSFKPTKGNTQGSIMGKGTVSTGRPPLKVSATLANRVAIVKPESVPLPLSPGEKANLPPKDIPLPKSPIHATQKSDDDLRILLEAYEKEVKVIAPRADFTGVQASASGTGLNEMVYDDETGLMDEAARHHDEDDVCDQEEEEEEVEEVEQVERDDGEEDYQGDKETTDTRGPGHPAGLLARDTTTGSRPMDIPTSILVSPVAAARGSSLKSSPISVSLPRALSPVLTTAMPPASPESDVQPIPHVIATGDGQKGLHAAPVYPTHLIDVSSPGDLPSPFLKSAQRLEYIVQTNLSSPASSNFISKATTRGPPSMTDSDSDDDLDGITSNLGQQQSRHAGRHKKPHSVQNPSADLVELSASSRPAHGERKDVSTPIKGAEMLLAKVIGTQGTVKGISTPSTRSVLSARDANRSDSSIEGDEEV